MLHAHGAAYAQLLHRGQTEVILSYAPYQNHLKINPGHQTATSITVSTMIGNTVTRCYILLLLLLLGINFQAMDRETFQLSKWR